MNKKLAQNLIEIGLLILVVAVIGGAVFMATSHKSFNIAGLSKIKLSNPNGGDNTNRGGVNSNGNQTESAGVLANENQSGLRAFSSNSINDAYEASTETVGNVADGGGVITNPTCSNGVCTVPGGGGGGNNGGDTTGGNTGGGSETSGTLALTVLVPSDVYTLNSAIQNAPSGSTAVSTYSTNNTTARLRYISRVANITNEDIITSGVREFANQASANARTLGGTVFVELPITEGVYAVPSDQLVQMVIMDFYTVNTIDVQAYSRFRTEFRAVVNSQRIVHNGVCSSAIENVRAGYSTTSPTGSGSTGGGGGGSVLIKYTQNEEDLL